MIGETRDSPGSSWGAPGNGARRAGESFGAFFAGWGKSLPESSQSPFKACSIDVPACHVMSWHCSPCKSTKPIISECVSKIHSFISQHFWLLLQGCNAPIIHSQIRFVDQNLWWIIWSTRLPPDSAFCPPLWKTCKGPTKCTPGCSRERNPTLVGPLLVMETKHGWNNLYLKYCFVEIYVLPHVRGMLDPSCIVVFSEEAPLESQSPPELEQTILAMLEVLHKVRLPERSYHARLW